jgi:hypothetical protein
LMLLLQCGRVLTRPHFERCSALKPPLALTHRCYCCCCCRRRHCCHCCCHSVDEYWHVPHFEKMLYDNPQLALTYLDAFRVTLPKQRSSSSSNPGDAADAAAALASPSGSSGGGSGGDGTSGDSGVTTADEVLYDPRAYATVVRGVLDYLRRDMTHPEGGLYSAEVRVRRAFSGPEGQGPQNGRQGGRRGPLAYSQRGRSTNACLMHPVSSPLKAHWYQTLLCHRALL